MDFIHVDNGQTEESMLAAGETHSRSPILSLGDVAELRSVGQVEISDDATLEDLKTQVKYEGRMFIRSYHSQNAIRVQTRLSCLIQYAEYIKLFDSCF